MSVKISISHNTIYSYNKPVALSPHFLRLIPAAHSKTKITNYSLKILPVTNIIHRLEDPFGNSAARVDFQGLVTKLDICVEMNAEIELVNPFDFFVDEYAVNFPFKYSDRYEKFLLPYLETRDGDAILSKWVQQIDKSTNNTISFIAMINTQLYNDIAYNVRLQPGVQTPGESLERKTGSCRDTAWLLVQIFRSLKMAARFVSGYLVQLADVDTVDTVDTVGLHAWAEVYIPGAGWIGLDPSSGLFAAKGYIPLACTPDFEDAAVITGTSDVANAELSYTSTVVRLN